MLVADVCGGIQRANVSVSELVRGGGRGGDGSCEAINLRSEAVEAVFVSEADAAVSGTSGSYEFELAGLEPGVPLYVRVRALNSLGTSLPVDSLAAVAPYGAPVAPRGATSHLAAASEQSGVSGETEVAANIDLAWDGVPFGGPYGPFGSPIESFDVKLAKTGRKPEVQRITATVAPVNSSSSLASTGSFRLSFVTRNPSTGRFPTTSAEIAAARDAGTE